MPLCMQARLDLTSYAKERVGIADFAANNMTFISPANETYPHGVCNYSEIPRFLSGRWLCSEYMCSQHIHCVGCTY